MNFITNLGQELSDFLTQINFRNNSNLRPQGVTISYTQEMIDELRKCKNDPVYFITNYIHVVHPDRGVVKMELYDYQEKMIDMYDKNRKVVFLTSRQQGKCQTLNTKVKIRNKNSGQIVEITLGDFYEWEKFRSIATDEELQTLQNAISTKSL